MFEVLVIFFFKKCFTMFKVIHFLVQEYELDVTALTFFLQINHQKFMALFYYLLNKIAAESTLDGIFSSILPRFLSNQTA